MTTKTTIILSPIKRCYTSPNLKKRRITSILINRKYQTNFSLTIPTIITVSCEKQNLSSNHLPDLLNDLLIEQQRRETIINIATILRKVGDQMDEQLKVMKCLLEIFINIFFISV
jgi:late competence protein required for DNA uptake (superfamily II DNA/RNA helicase)